MLHLVNGDATAGVLARSGLPGESAVWRDILVEGPVAGCAVAPAAMPGRVAYLAERLAIDPDQYRRLAREQEADLLRAGGHDEVVLWFEQDLFCAVNLWYLLARFAGRQPARLSLVFPDTRKVRGLGMMTPEDLAALFGTRRPLDSVAVAAGAAAWAAYARPEPTAVERLLHGEEPLPFLAQAARSHLGRLPSTRDGLNDIERAVLATVSETPQSFAALVARVGTDEAVRHHGVADVQLAGTVREMSAGPGPLLVVAGVERRPDTWTVAIARSGRDVLAGRVDRMSRAPVNRWVGGVRVAPGHPAWSWDGHRVRRADAA